MAATSSHPKISKKYINSERNRACHSSNFENIDVSSYSAFFAEYLLPNKPCVFAPELTKSWRSRQDWAIADGRPNFCLLKYCFGEAVVPVANCKQEEYSSHCKTEMLMSEYIDYWQKYKHSGYNTGMDCLYLKDWHFIKKFPEYEAYSTPIYFQSDWLNEYWDTLPNDDYRFVYMGPKGTWTPFHADVFRSYSWSANICGKKKWIFYPPGCEESLKDRLGNLVYDVMSPDLKNTEMFPNADKVKGQMLEVIQGQGQVIFVPSGWHHQVFNMEDTISINHNWLNACNIDICWKHLQDNLSSVQAEIGDCRDMEGWTEQCQLILKATAGIDYLQFINMLGVIAKHRIAEYHKLTNSTGKGDNDSQSGVELNNTIGDCDCDKVSKHDVEFNNTNGDCDSDKGSKGDVKNTEGGFKSVADSKHGVEFNNTEDGCESDADSKCCLELNNTEGDCDVELESVRSKFDNLGHTLLGGTEEEVKLSGGGNSCRCNIDDDSLVCETCEDVYLKEVSELKSSIQNWTACDYVLFDLQRIREVLEDIVDKTDYQLLAKPHEDSAEYILEVLNEHFTCV